MTADTAAPLWTRSATALAGAIRAGEVTSREVVDACLRRVAEVNPAVNAATVVFEDRARRAAEAADAALRESGRADLGPLHGVPFSVKENIDLTWSATTNGLPLLKDAVPGADGTGIARLRAAGAIPLIRTNMPDLGMRWHTDNALFGATVNPWDAGRTPGGSSGGEGAAIATGMTPFGIGNDYGGSVRLPAHANGVCGLKPTPGRIPVWKPGPGVFPFTAQAFSVEGPLARTVDDLALAYSVMCGPDGIDTLTVPVVDDPFPDAPRRVAVVTDPGGGGTAPSVTAAVRRAADALRQAGWEVTEAEPPLIAEAALLWRELIISDQLEFLYSPRAGLIEHCSVDARRCSEDFAAHTRRLGLADYGAAVGRRIEIRAAWSAFQREFPVILAPVITQLPFTVGRDLEGPDASDEIFQANRLLVAVNCLGNPAVALPVGTVTDGMPDGVQVIGPWFGERLALAAARDVERACGAVTPIDPRLRLSGAPRRSQSKCPAGGVRAAPAGHEPFAGNWRLTTVSRTAESAWAVRLCGASGTMIRSPSRPSQDSAPAARVTRPRSTRTVASPGLACSASAASLASAMTVWRNAFSWPPTTVRETRESPGFSPPAAWPTSSRASASRDSFCMVLP